MSLLPPIQISGEAGGMPNYENAVRRAGGVPLYGYCPEPDLSCAGLLLCGGGDPDPGLFGQQDRGSDPPDRDRDRAELGLIAAFLSAGRPILGICRGMQMISVALGGDLIQNLPPERLFFHGRSDRDLVHPLRTAEGSLIHSLYGPRIQVNSNHHQAVGRLGRGLVATAWSEGGVVEVLEHPGLPVLGVQFHPERMSWEKRRPDTADGEPIFRWFLNQCRRYL